MEDELRSDASAQFYRRFFTVHFDDVSNKLTPTIKPVTRDNYNAFQRLIAQDVNGVLNVNCITIENIATLLNLQYDHNKLSNIHKNLVFLEVSSVHHD